MVVETLEMYKVVLFIGSLTTFILLTTSCAGQSWVEVEFRGFELQIGLWQYCYSEIKLANPHTNAMKIEYTICDKIENFSNMIEAVQTFMVISILSSVIATCLTGYAIYSNNCIRTALIFLGVSMIFCFAAVLTFTENHEEHSKSVDEMTRFKTLIKIWSKYGWSYAFGWIAIINMIFCLSCGGLANCQEK